MSWSNSNRTGRRSHAAWVWVGMALWLSACESGESGESGGKDNALPDCPPCEEGEFCYAGSCQPSGEVVVSGELGDGGEQFGASNLEEAASEAPQALAAESNGSRLLVLDQLNQRISVFGPAGLVKTLPVEDTTSEEIALLPGERIVVRNRYQDEFRVMDFEGSVMERSPVSGDGLESIAYAGPLYTRDNGVWMEAAGRYIHVLDTEGKPAQPRRVLPGLPSPDLETLVTLKLLADGSLHLISRPAKGVPAYTQRQLRMSHPVVSVSAQDIDAQGRLFLVTDHLASREDDTARYSQLSVLSPELEVLRQEELPAKESDRFSSRRVAVSRSGSVFYLNIGAEQVSVLGF